MPLVVTTLTIQPDEAGSADAYVDSRNPGSNFNNTLLRTGYHTFTCNCSTCCNSCTVNSCSSCGSFTCGCQTCCNCCDPTGVGGVVCDCNQCGSYTCGCTTCCNSCTVTDCATCGSFTCGCQTCYEGTFHSLVLFSLSSIPNPAKIVLINADLSLVYDSGVTGKIVRVERALGSWTETGATWNNRPTSTEPISRTVTTGINTWNVTSQVQAMLRYGNNGFVVRPNVDDADADSRVAWRSSAHATVADRPRLVLRYRSPYEGYGTLQ